MKVLKRSFVVLFFAVFLTSCSVGNVAIGEKNSETSAQSGTDNIDNAVINYQDIAGNVIRLTDDQAIKSVDLSYALGWTLSDTSCKKIKSGDKIAGLRVVNAKSTYFPMHFADRSLIYGNMRSAFVHADNRYSLVSDNGGEEGFELSGIITTDSDGNIFFYPYKDKNGEDFPFLCEYNEAVFSDFSERSILEINGDKIEVQPIGISLPISFEDQIRDKLSEDKFFTATIEFDNIDYWVFSDGEGSECYGTRASGNLRAR